MNVFRRLYVLPIYDHYFERNRSVVYVKATAVFRCLKAINRLRKNKQIRFTNQS